MRRRFCTVAVTAVLAVGSGLVAGVGGATAAPTSPQDAQIVRHTSSAVVPQSDRAASANAAETSLGSRLNSGQTMNGQTEYLTSDSGQFEVAADGLLDPEVGLYWNSYSSGGQGISVDPNGNSTHVLAMQADGNLVLYTNGGTVTWASNTEGNPGAFAVLQNDGNFVVYTAAGRAAWGSGTFATDMFSYTYQGEQELTYLEAGWFLANNGYTLVMQPDGNLVLYAPTGRAVWASNTNGNPDAVAVLQPDGNFTVYSASSKALWGNGRSYAQGLYVLSLQRDGNLVQYRDALTSTSQFRVIWATNTAGKR